MFDEAPDLRRPTRWALVVSRIVDVSLACVLMVIVAPVLLLVALAIRLDSAGPVLYRQCRIGRDQHPFTMLKFRSMTMGGDDRAHRELIARELAGEDTSRGGSCKMDDDPRVTRVGRFIRRTSIDELPQLLNVIAGSMSLVGPRPCLGWEAAQFPARYLRRFDVRPGITGLWQVSGRSTMGTREMLELDVRYVDRWSVTENLRILLLTVPTVLRSDGAR
ncbi:Sugar transferase involved in LPS biosynthesis (colanic, teichoic acid) [Pseudonocardia ammonioxydans]|uniref:Sugar transferase involved in LPS biosynthesis (Colanic, teichoic acid) n=1 Tax=Pseudonocardia ammonioxydans TaxID=260086 RepID=A0A1I5CHY3_PSUAM|nr:sugar transferase [Pseudonocardia ammonioxydans]SFN86639.1 Sugar transferase involved in LPS biosynthesis (colanic, teichoic acid) [Pseudonocardia ammonioxydans]